MERTALLIISLLMCYVAVCQDVKQIALLNEHIKKFKVEKDDFYPEKTTYTHKKYSGLSFLSKNRFIYPIVHADSLIVLHSLVHKSYIDPPEKLVIKTSDELIEFVTVQSDYTYRSSTYERNYVNYGSYMITPEDLKMIASTPNMTIRVYSKSGFEEIKADSEAFKETYILYQLLSVNKKWVVKED